MSFVAVLFVLASVLGGTVLVVKGWRMRRAAAATTEAEVFAYEVPDVSDAVAQKVAALLTDQERRLAEAVTGAVHGAMAGLREDVSGLKSDVEWLAGERMIEQAIALAQTGSDPEEIGQELGLSRDTAATIAMFRKH